MTSSPRLRIAQIGSRGIPGHSGGVERVVEAVAPRLAARGHEVTVYCASWSPQRPEEHRGVRLRYAWSPRSKHLDTFVRSLGAAVREMFRRADVCHVHASGSAPLALLLRLAGKRVVVTVHGRDFERQKWGRAGRWFLQLGERAAVRLADETIVVGPELKRQLERDYGTEVRYIPNGVEPRPHRPADRIRRWGVDGRDYVLFLARLVPEKQCDVLIRAYRALPAEVRDRHRLLIAGPTWHSEEHVAALRGLAGGDPSIVFCGEVDEPTLEELYGNCSVYVLPSRVEGMSLSLLDAMGFGAATICSDIPANAEVVGEAGRTFRVGDVADLAGTLCTVLAEDGLAEGLRSAARRRITTEFDWDEIAGLWEDCYLDVTGRVAATRSALRRAA